MKAFMILSAHRSEYNAEANAYRHAEAFDLLSEYAPQVVEGMYKGTEETSILVPIPKDSYARQRVLQVAHRFGQESVLEVDTDGTAYLIFDGEHKPLRIGAWTGIAPADTFNVDAWTKIDDNFFTAK